MFYSTATLYIRYGNVFFVAAIILFLSSCSTVKNYPVRQSFVYKTNIEVEGKFSTDEKKQLVSQLNQQLHDSIRVREVQKLIGWEKGPKFFYSVLSKPPLYDSLNADKSVQFMKALLHSLGYYRDTISFDTSVVKKDDQYRTTVNFKVNPGKLIRLDSIRYNLENDTLQKITLEEQKNSLIKKGEPFAKPIISTEFNRLVDLYRNNGYLLFSFDDLLAVWDTVGLALLRPTIDPIEQAQQLQELQRRRANPTADLEVRLRPNNDSLNLIRYYVGNITVYPDLSADTALYQSREILYNGYRIISYYDYFKPIVVTENISLARGQLYDQRNYLKTLNRFNTLGAWRLVSIDQKPRAGTDTVDFVIKLSPARKYSFDVNLEGSKNFNTFIAGDLLGLGINLGLQNRNFAHAANQANTNLRYGIELNSNQNLLQTQQVSLGHNILFPRFIPRLKNNTPDFLKDRNIKTILSFNAGIIDRKDFFSLATFNTSWGYELNWKTQSPAIRFQKNKLLAIRFPNIEYSFLVRRDTLKKLIENNASFKYIFNNGLITSTIARYVVSYSKKNRTSQVQLNGEISGFLLGYFRTKFLDSNLYRFRKFDAEYRQTIKIRRKQFAWRVFAGAGFSDTRFPEDSINFFLPFFRQYYGGGANSMRAWGLRKLGPGSTVKSFARTIAPDRFGDIQLEANAEYRFYLAEINGVTLNSALFTDIGNVWFRRYNPDFPGGEFKFNKLWKDIAIGLGTGLRIDFGFLNIRLDYAFKVKDPSPDRIEEQNKWFYQWQFNNGQFQLGVNYPF
jgi:outer membrane protein assembly factor BamA